MNPKREELILDLGGFVCSKCGYDDPRALQIDHIFSNGKEMPLQKNTIIQYYLENPDIADEELQILCANCNWIKRAENYEAKH